MPTKDSIFSLSMTKVIDRFGKSDKDVYQTIPIIASLTQLVQSVTLTRWKSLVRTQQGAHSINTSYYKNGPLVQWIEYDTTDVKIRVRLFYGPQ